MSNRRTVQALDERGFFHIRHSSLVRGLVLRATMGTV
jgi:hypothetical protein